MNTLPVYLFIVLTAVWTTDGFPQVSGFDQVGTTSFQFLKVIPNARAAAIGDAASATIRTAEASFFNPAALTYASDLDISLSYLDWFQDVKITSFALSHRFSGVGTFAVHALVADLGEIEETRADRLLRDDATGLFNPGLTGNTLSSNSFALGLSFAKFLTDKFSFGVTAKIAREDLIAQAVTGLIFDGGVTYRTGFRSLELGMMLRNFGAEVQYFDESFPLPQSFTIGISGYLAGPEGAFLLPNDTHRLLVAYDLSQTRDHSQQQHLGLEYSLTDFLYLRGGYKFNFDEEGLTLGFGLKVSQFGVNYAYNDFGDFLGNVQRFTVRFLMD